MPTLNVTFAFASDAQSFTATAGTNSTLTYDGATGNPAGALKSVVSGSNRNDNNSWARTLTYEAMGVPTGATITGITSASLQSKCTAFASGTGCTSGAVTLVDGVTTVTLSAQRSFTATDANWVTTNGTNATGLSKASSNSVTITIPNHLGTTSGGSGKGVTLYQDQLTFTITYTEPALPKGSYTLTGNAANLLKGSALHATLGNIRQEDGALFLLESGDQLLAETTFDVAWKTVAGVKGVSMPAAKGTFTLTGNAATLSRTRVQSASTTAFTLTGKTANLLRGYPLSATVTTFAETGNTANLLKGYKQIANVTTFALSGTTTGLIRTRLYPASTTAFTLTGNTAGLVKQTTLTASTTSFTLTGKAVAFPRTYKFTSTVTTFALTGTTTGLKRALVQAASPTAFTLTGQTVGFTLGKKFIATVTPFTLTGNAASSVRSVTVTLAAVKDQAVSPALNAGTVTVATTPTALRLLAVAPSPSTAVTVAVTPTTLALLAVPPAIDASGLIAVPMVRITEVAIPPTVDAAVEVAVDPAALWLSAWEPSITPYSVVTPATLTLAAVSPTITGGGGAPLGVLPKKSGD